jgi:assimilatory nitrate reductase catalytic subunit
MAGTDTHCPYCALQCGMTLHEDAAGWTVTGRDFPTNKGGLCRKGFTSAEVLSAPDRLTTPLLRDTETGALRPAGWDEALDVIAAGIKRVQEAHGRDAVAIFGGGGLTNEKAYLLGKFARVAPPISTITAASAWPPPPPPA